VTATRTQFILVRHGETEWNRLGRIQGHLDSPLNPQGVAQAESVAARLEHEPFDRLVCSDLGRAISTAMIIAKRTGHEVEADARLRERHYGIFQGMTRAEARSTYPDTYAEYEVEDVDHAIPSGESSRQCFRRNLACLQELAARHVGGRLVVVAHGGVLDGLHRHVLGLSHVGARAFTIVNASLNWFSYEGGAWQLERWGDAAHLGFGEALDDV
jgi:probable phosphoglycerate mutase